MDNNSKSTALERAKATYGTGEYDDATLEFLFPQLKKSEEQQKIDNIIDVLRLAIANSGAALFKKHNVTYEQCTDFVNSLYHQHPAKEWSEEDIKKIRSEEYTKGFNDAAFGGKLNEWSEEEAKKAAEDYADEFPGMTHESDGSTIEDYDKPYNDFMAGVLWAKHQCRPKQEWSEEDEIYLQDALWCIKQASKVARGENDMGACWSAERWLKSLRPQPKQEWSEEDEETLKDLIRSVTGFDATTGIISQNFKQHEKKINFLKSLRPQPKQEWNEGDKEILSEKEKEFYRQNGRLDVLYAPEKYDLQPIEETKKETHSTYGWVARDAFKNALTLFLNRKPYRPSFNSLGIWHTTGNFITLSSDLWEGNPNDLFPNLKWEDEPLPVKINIVEDKHDN